MRLFICLLIRLFIRLGLVMLAHSALALNAPTPNEQQDHNWLTHGRTDNEQRFSPLTDINDKNISQLGLAWYFDLDHNRGLEGTPIVVDGVMYSTGNWNMVYANNAATGELLWKFDPQVDRSRAVLLCCDVVNRGVAVWEGKVFTGTLDGYLVALDAKSGKEIWRTLTVDQSKPYSITGAPRVIKGKVIIGNAGAEYGVRGYVSAYDVHNGTMLWRFYTVPGDPALPADSSINNASINSKAMEMAAKTWSGTAWLENGGGGTVWDSMAYDAELNQLYIGVGNAGPWNRELRNPEHLDNLFTSSIVSLNPDTGAYNWHYQETPNDGWDYTATQHIILADVEWKGKSRKVLMQAPKNGFFFVIDRVTGEYLSAKPYAQVNWALGYDDKGRPIENPEKNYKDGKQTVRPSPMGAHNWQPMSFNPQTGLVYIPALDGFFEYDPDHHAQMKKNVWNTGMKPLPAPPGEMLFVQAVGKQVMRGSLLAWDPLQQKARWEVEYPATWNGGVLSTAGNLVLQGTAMRELVAYSADKGEKLWAFPAQTGVIAPPITYTVNGEQYIAVLAGWGGAFALAGGIKPPASPARNRILAFKLNGRVTLPALPEQGKMYDPPPRMVVDDTVLEEGKMLYHSYCMSCHGVRLVSHNALPDLRTMHPSFHENFNQIVLGGVLKNSGMVSFAQVLDQQQADALHAYILDEAHKDKALRDNPPPQWWVAVKTWVYSLFGKLVHWLI
jgi:quinohemoprotein ethanol dehydrogenase